jgi:hypothetical protein
VRSVGQIDEQGQRRGLLRALPVPDGGRHGLQSHERIGLPDGQVAEQAADPVAGVPVGRRGHRDGDQVAHGAALDGLAPMLEQRTEAAGHARQHDVVHGDAERTPGRLDLRERHPGARPGAALPHRGGQRARPVRRGRADRRTDVGQHATRDRQHLPRPGTR